MQSISVAGLALTVAVAGEGADDGVTAARSFHAGVAEVLVAAADAVAEPVQPAARRRVGGAGRGGAGVVPAGAHHAGADRAGSRAGRARAGARRRATDALDAVIADALGVAAAAVAGRDLRTGHAAGRHRLVRAAAVGLDAAAAPPEPPWPAAPPSGLGCGVARRGCCTPRS